MQTLYKHTKEREAERLKFEAILHGARFDDEEEKSPGVFKEHKEPTEKESIFKDPSAYEGWSKEEKEKETKRLMNMTKQMLYDPKENEGKTKMRTIFSGMRG